MHGGLEAAFNCRKANDLCAWNMSFPRRKSGARDGTTTTWETSISKSGVNVRVGASSRPASGLRVPSTPDTVAPPVSLVIYQPKASASPSLQQVKAAPVSKMALTLVPLTIISKR